MNEILLVCTKYPSISESDWLTSELAESINCIDNYNVNVLCMDWKLDNSTEKYIRNAIEVSRFSLLDFFNSRAGAQIFLKWLIYSPLAALHFRKLLAKKYNLIILISPCASSWFICFISKLIAKKNLLIYWDFFPIHNQQIGMMSNGIVSKLLYFLEKTCVKNFDYIGCMSPKNIEFFENYFGKVKSSSKLLEIPIWSSDTNISHYNQLMEYEFYDSSHHYFVFGGQLVPGRGLQVAMEAALLAYKVQSTIRLLIFGAGPLSKEVEEFSLKSSGIVRYCGSVPRNLYKSILINCTGGIVSTVDGVSVPTYPSKSLDYMMASLPILASVENSTDFGEMIELYGAGIKCKAGDSKSLSSAMCKIANNSSLRKEMGINARKMYEARHQTKEVTKLICDLNKGEYVQR